MAGLNKKLNESGEIGILRFSNDLIDQEDSAHKNALIELRRVQ